MPPVQLYTTQYSSSRSHHSIQPKTSPEDQFCEALAQEKSAESNENVDLRQAFNIYKNLADKHMIPEAGYRLALMLESGKCSLPDPEQAVIYYKKAADLGSANAQMRLGEMYKNGIGVEKNFETAVSYLRMAHQQGYPEANYLLGRMYHGNAFDLKSRGELQLANDQYALAHMYFELAVESNHIQAGFKLGEMAYWGDGVPEDERLAFDLFQKAHLAGSPDATCMLGYMYRNGLPDRPADEVKALEYFKEAEARGYAEAAYQLAMSATNESRLDDAFKLLKKAHDGGYRQGTLQLGVRYEETNHQPLEAAKCYQIAAAIGHTGLTAVGLVENLNRLKLSAKEKGQPYYPPKRVPTPHKYNSVVEFNGEPMVCRHLATKFICKSFDNVDKKIYADELFGSKEKVAAQDWSDIQNQYDSLKKNAAAVHILPCDNLGKHIQQCFDQMKPNDKKTFLLESIDHSMVIRLALKEKVVDGDVKACYVVKFFDPNDTDIEIRCEANSKDQLDQLALRSLMTQQRYESYFGRPNSALEDKECILFECTNPSQINHDNTLQAVQARTHLSVHLPQPITRTTLWYLLLDDEFAPAGFMPDLKALSAIEQESILSARVQGVNEWYGLTQALYDGNASTLSFYRKLFDSSNLDSATKKKILFARTSENDPEPGIYFIDASQTDTINWYFKLLKDSLNDQDYVALMGELLNANVKNCAVGLRKAIAQELVKHKMSITADFVVEHLSALGRSDLEVKRKKEWAKEFVKDFLSCLNDQERKKLEQQIRTHTELKYLRQKTGIFVNKSAAPIYADDVGTYVDILAQLQRNTKVSFDATVFATKNRPNHEP